MKKKIFAFLFVLASVIACTVCVAACNGGANRADYVGKYEFVSIKMTANANGEKMEQSFNVGENGIEKDFILLELKEDGTYKMNNSKYYMQITGGLRDAQMEGEWSVSGGKLILKSSGFDSGVLKGDRLTFVNKVGAGSSGAMANYEMQLVFNKVATDTPAE